MPAGPAALSSAGACSSVWLQLRPRDGAGNCQFEPKEIVSTRTGFAALYSNGVVEAFERSMCLLARTAARDADAVCRSCCEKKGPRRALEALPKINAAADHDKHAERAAPRLSPPKKKRPRPQRPPP